MPNEELGIDDNPPLAIADAPNTDVPMTAPPAIRKMVVIIDFSFIPMPKEVKNKIIDVAPNIIPRSAALIGRKPCFPCPTAASAIYTSTNAIATIASTSEIFRLRTFC